MAKLFSVASWNVEHFGEPASKRKKTPDPARVKRVIDFLAALNPKPDIFGIYEVEGKHVFDALVAAMPGYSFHITEGLQTQEILVGVSNALPPAMVTQRTEFRSGTTHMRPGQLVSLKIGNERFAILFLHLASGVDPRGMGLRDDMVERAFEFKKDLDKKAAGGRANFLFVGDLNSMGLDYPMHDIPSAAELAKWDSIAKRKTVGMRRLPKTHPNSWSNGSSSNIPDSSLDHAYVADHLNIPVLTAKNGSKAETLMTGWVDATTNAAKDKWIEEFSDHSLLYFEVHS